VLVTVGVFVTARLAQLSLTQAFFLHAHRLRSTTATSLAKTLAHASEAPGVCPS